MKMGGTANPTKRNTEESYYSPLSKTKTEDEENFLINCLVYRNPTIKLFYSSMHLPLYVNKHEAKRKRGKGSQMHEGLKARKGKAPQRKSCRMISLNITDARDSYLL